MAGAFGGGRGRSSRIRFQSRGRYRKSTATTRRGGRREKAVRKPATERKCCQSKAGTGKAEEGSESGSSEESSAPSYPKPKTSSNCKTCRRGRRRRGGGARPIRKGPNTSLSWTPPPTVLSPPTPPTTRAATSAAVAGRIRCATTPPTASPATQEALLLPFFLILGAKPRMADTTHQTTSSRLGGGEIVEVQGGHIVRSIGRKDRHSKVCTAKGPRDRRVRLSAQTAIQFYDVQDRLGYDRPSKAVDWLIKKAKATIDELAELPAWNPTLANANFEQEQAQKQQKQELRMADTVVGSSSSREATAMALLGTNDAARCGVQNQNRPLQISSENNSGFLPPSLDSDAIADTIKSFFPVGAAAETNSSAMQCQNFPPPDLLSRISSQSQDLRLSLLSSQDPMLLHHHHRNQTPHHQNPTRAIFSGTTQLGFDASGWSEHRQAEIACFQRMATWSGGGDADSGGGDAESGGGGGFFLNLPPSPLLGHNQLFSQRGPLQSSNPPSIHAWIDPSSIASATTANHPHHTIPLHPSSVPGIGFASGGGFSVFRIPAQIQGEEEEHDGISNKPSSPSSQSRR